MGDDLRGDFYSRTVQVLCGFVLCIVLVAGLWPFHAPRNDVSWFKNDDGLSFGVHGMAWSSLAFPENDTGDGTSCSIEVWLEPEKVTSDRTILAFDSSADPGSPFSLRQYGSSFAVQHRMVDDLGVVRRVWLKVENVFHERRSVLVTITSSVDNTKIYADGLLIGGSSDLKLVRRDLTGRLVVANSTTDDSWSGKISGLAIYDRELKPDQVARHFESWTANRGPMLTGEKIPLALYLFNEREGNIVHNWMDPATDLVIPTKYLVLHPRLLRPAWDQSYIARYAWTRPSYWENVTINIAGFIPVGFMLFIYLSSVVRIKCPVLSTIFLGFVLSLTIEVLQWFLPTRDSGMNDLITNTIGTILGVLLCQSPKVQACWARVMTYAGQVRGCHPAAFLGGKPRQGEDVPLHI
jgi:VanZ like family/Concanavalin A-like lectin/glucanases superfamily